MKLPPAYLVVQAVIAALLSVAVATVIARLVLGPPPFAVVFLGAEMLQLAAALAFKIRRSRERRRLQDAFDRPAFGEDLH